MSPCTIRRLILVVLASGILQTTVEPLMAGPVTYRAGVTVRRIGADFHLNARSPAIDIYRGAGRPQSRGKGGLFGGGEGQVVYDDGSVGPGFSTVAGNQDDGSAYGSITNRNQVYDTGRIDEFGDPILAVDFHAQELTGDHTSAYISDAEVGVGPYLQAAISLIEKEDLILNAVLGWSMVRTNHSSGTHRLVTVRGSDNVYTYDTVLLEPLSDFPYTDPADSSGLGAFIIDSNNAVVTPLGKDPEQHANRVQRLARALATVNLGVTLNEIPLGIELGKRFGKLEAFFTAGATLNIISYSLESRLVWHRTDGTTLTERWADEGDSVRMGLYGGLMVRYPLCESGRVYLEAHGTYRWVDPASAEAGFASVEIDPSSWEGGMGLGVEW